MQLKDMKRTGKAGATRHVVSLADDLGKSDCELSIHGPAKLVERAFEKCTFDISIRPKATAADSETQSREMWRRYYPTAKPLVEAPGLELFDKRKVAQPTKGNSLVISLRRTRGEGTLWSGLFPNLFIPAGANLFFGMPSVCNCSGALFPSSGDSDLFLTLNGITTPTVAASVKAGTAIDSIFFGSSICWPWAEFWPFFRVNGFATGVSTFWMTGFGVFP
jgi:hypothetical protein